MIKYIIFILNLLFFVDQSIAVNNHQIPKLSPKSVLFLWDLHDVLLQKSSKKIIQIMWQYEHKRKLFSQLSFGLLKKIMSTCWRQIRSGGNGEEFILVAQEYNNPYLAELIIRAVNAQYPIQGSVEILQMLHDAGYTNYIGSNIGASAFKEISNPTKYPYLADLFSLFDLKHPQVVHYHANYADTIKKPDPRFFLSFLEHNKIDIHKTTVIFIDDNYANIQAAKKLGFTAIRFKNATQLKNDLEKLGFDFKKNLKVPQKTVTAV